MIRASKPYADFPLTLHRNRQWCKKIRGKLRYFGTDWQEALDLFLNQRDDLYAGRTPRTGDEPTLGLAMDQFLSAKKLAEQAGEITARTYAEYEETCDKIAASVGADRLLTDIAVNDLEKLRSDLGRGKRGQLSAVVVKNELTRARSLFLYANEHLSERAIQYRRALRSPDRRLIRKAANERGPRMFEAKEIKAMLKAAPVQLRAMIYLSINCGFGNSDCGTLPVAKVDLKTGWHHYWRPKTHNERRCPLWPETVKAVKAAMEDRPKTVTDEAKGLVFVTTFGNPWTNAEERTDNAISAAFRKLLIDLGIYRKNVTTFYSLRRTLETIGATAGEQVALDFIMGHCGQDMASVYRQKVFDKPLRKVTDHVRAWLNGRKKIV